MIKRLVKLSISVAFWLLASLYRRMLDAFGIKRAGTCVVLYYHVVRSDEREKFARQMDTVLRLAKPISLGGPIVLEPGRHHVAVTFDDAFQDSLRIALPELEKRDIPVTVFVSTGCLGLPAPWLSGNEYEAQGGVVMSAEELKMVARNPLVSLGSHCLAHKALPSLSDIEARNEIFRSKAELERILGREVMTLSFPHGAFEEKHLTMAREVCYRHVFSIEPVLAFTKHDDFLVGRVRVDPADWHCEFRLKVIGAYQWAVSMKKLLASNNRHE